MSLKLPKINGTLSPIYKGMRVQYDPQRGRQSFQEWESAGVGLAGIASLCEQHRVSYDHVVSRIRSRLTLSSSGAQEGATDLPIDSWQLLANELHPSIKEHPYFLGGLTTAEIGRVQADADVLKRDGSLDAGTTAFYADPGDIVSKNLLDFLARDITHYAQGQWVLKHTANVSNGYAGYAELTGEEKIYTTSLMLGEISSGWTYPCPLRMRVKIGYIDATKGAVHTGRLWGWRKLPSTETTAANSRIDISYEYWFGEWSTILYGVFTS